MHSYVEFLGPRHRRQARHKIDRHGEFDRFQITTEHPAPQIIAEDAGLGFERTDGVVMIQIFTQRGRSDEAKTTLYARIHDMLADVIVLRRSS